MSVPHAEILAIGSEILLGEILDTNTQMIALGLRRIGLNLFRTAAVGDNSARIAGAIRLAASRCDVLLMTGGLGPTVDDVTRQATAEAAAVELEFSPELWRVIEARYASFGRTPKENNRRQAYLPQGAEPIPNPVGTAPGFWLDLGGCRLFALPGVPAEMEQMLDESVLPLLQRDLALQAAIVTRTLRTVGMGESDLDAAIGDLELGDNPTLGVSAHPGRVDLRLGARADNPSLANKLLDPLEAELRRRLGDRIYGVGDETLEAVVMAELRRRKWDLGTIEGGTGGMLAGALEGYSPPFRSGLVLPPLKSREIVQKLRSPQGERRREVTLALEILHGNHVRQLRGWLLTPLGEDHFEIDYPGPSAHAAPWAISRLLSRLRDQLSSG